MLRQKWKKGFTLIELLIVMTIVGILAAIAIPVYKNYTIQAKITDVTNAMRYIASAVTDYCQDLTISGGSYAWPNCPDITAIQSTLGVGLAAARRISAAQVIQSTGEIEMTLSNIDSSVDGRTLSLVPTIAGDGSINWSWSGTLQPRYLPKN